VQKKWLFISSNCLLSRYFKWVLLNFIPIRFILVNKMLLFYQKIGFLIFGKIACRYYSFSEICQFVNMVFEHLSYRKYVIRTFIHSKIYRVEQMVNRKFGKCCIFCKVTVGNIAFCNLTFGKNT
jgi:hypothetical protein